MKIFTLSALAVVLSFASGCTTHLAEGQKQELSIYESKGLVVKDKSVGAAAALGLLPGVGYFYTGHPVLGITTIPLYVISLGPLWMPFDTAAAAESRNYYSTKIQVERDRAKALRELDHKLEDKQLSYEQHLREQRLIEAKYSAY
ncbi:TM2 domain-containing protein [Pseudomonas sp. MWU12-2115]|uniref:TM2 domain-containing protein n=1 Tax=unclassified Pseudomonas TaxID=196821 RepID=UPI000DDAB3DA|nr:TM2 domain-containing protein [Pseudomonas sp. MWU12-2020]RBB97330.1 TM2 domain-containing protein [Pseudomonas sp. MWU12-2115]